MLYARLINAGYFWDVPAKYVIQRQSHRGNLTGHVQLPPLEPLDLPSAQIAVPHRVKSSDPAQSVTSRGGPELLAVGHREVLQRGAVRHPLEPRSLRHKGRNVAPPAAGNTEIGAEQPTADGGEDGLGARQHCCERWRQTMRELKLSSARGPEGKHTRHEGKESRGGMP